jgi:hypothetical protein
MRSTVLIFILAAATVVASHVRLDENLQKFARINELAQRQQTFLPTPEAVRWLSGGFDKLIADLYWLQFIQYCGEAENDRGEFYRRSSDYVNLITGLDPTFTKPYWFGCWAVGYWQKRPDLADKILQRGISANPDAWDLAYLAGVNQQLFAKNNKEAARYYKLAASKPNAPDFLMRRADILLTDLPELQKRFRSLLDMYYNDKNDTQNMKPALYRALVDVLREEYKEATGKPTVQAAIQVEMNKLTTDYSQWTAANQ